jgi:hypothetical protein
LTPKTAAGRRAGAGAFCPPCDSVMRAPGLDPGVDPPIHVFAFRETRRGWPGLQTSRRRVAPFARP